MGTSKRTPIHRSLVMQITPRAVAIYEQMCRIRCTCLPREYGAPYVQPCVNCGRWWRLHNELHRELKLRPWHWPTIPSISGGSRPGAEELEGELRQAAALERRAARARRKPVVDEAQAVDPGDVVVASDPAGVP
jgi:hypothetical protein